MSKAEEQADKLMAFLQKHKEDRGIMADLRCGFSEAKEHRAWPHIAQLCKLNNEKSRLPVQAVCAAFATHPENARMGNFGATMRKIDMATIEDRFKRLLICDTIPEICERIPSVIRAAKAKGIPVDYQLLCYDIRMWEDCDIKLDWADAFWGSAGGDE
jgi:CRISPR system Cascade subunit CasB